ncbi:hypothetical protein V22_28830 [Calycomorphotria hydatis]|uniref:Uncharacterized protein n=1 Tax=Calycomorphotria hydatis TaxID=2528027 RepID=A0A517TB89_9PLAN|nr:hypothetical protein V22_28830 [Calycomorphotria hydatis]
MCHSMHYLFLTYPCPIRLEPNDDYLVVLTDN